MAAIQAGDKELGKSVLNLIQKDCQQQSAYYASLQDGQVGPIQEYEYQMAEQLKARIEEELKKVK
jgi:hypothetical protein